MWIVQGTWFSFSSHIYQYQRHRALCTLAWSASRGIGVVEMGVPSLIHAMTIKNTTTLRAKHGYALGGIQWQQGGRVQLLPSIGESCSVFKPHVWGKLEKMLQSFAPIPYYLFQGLKSPHVNDRPFISACPIKFASGMLINESSPHLCSCCSAYITYVAHTTR